MRRVDRVERKGPAERSSGGDPEAISIEKALIARAQRGDRAALKRLLGLHADALYSRVILPRVGDVATAEDLLKMTMVTAIEKLETFRWQGRSIYHWLRQVAVNKVIDHHRRDKRRRRLAGELEREGELLDIAPSARPGPEAVLLAAEERRINAERITRVLDKINPRYRQAIELRLVQELSREACAEQLGITVNNFDVLLYRAIRAFRGAFGAR